MNIYIFIFIFLMLEKDINVKLIITLCFCAAKNVVLNVEIKSITRSFDSSV